MRFITNSTLVLRFMMSFIDLEIWCINEQHFDSLIYVLCIDVQVSHCNIKEFSNWCVTITTLFLCFRLLLFSTETRFDILTKIKRYFSFVLNNTFMNLQSKFYCSVCFFSVMSKEYYCLKCPHPIILSYDVQKG